MTGPRVSGQRDLVDERKRTNGAPDWKDCDPIIFKSENSQILQRIKRLLRDPRQAVVVLQLHFYLSDKTRCFIINQINKHPYNVSKMIGIWQALIIRVYESKSVFRLMS